MGATIVSIGDSAMMVRFASKMSDEAHRLVRQFLSLLAAKRLSGVIEWAPAYASVVVDYDPLQVTASTLKERLTEALESLTEIPEMPARCVEIPVHYGGDNGPDLETVARACGLTPKEVVALHASGRYRVDFIGFSPGFPYLSGMDERLGVPRRSTPRSRVPAGSVAIAGAQTGIYSRATAGGWQIIGRTPLTLFDYDASNPCLLTFGDEVLFRPIDALRAEASND